MRRVSPDPTVLHRVPHRRTEGHSHDGLDGGCRERSSLALVLVHVVAARELERGRPLSAGRHPRVNIIAPDRPDRDRAPARWHVVSKSFLYRRYVASLIRFLDCSPASASSANGRSRCEGSMYLPVRMSSSSSALRASASLRRLKSFVRFAVLPSSCGSSQVVAQCDPTPKRERLKCSGSVLSDLSCATRHRHGGIFNPPVGDPCFGYYAAFLRLCW